MFKVWKRTKGYYQKKLGKAELPFLLADGRADTRTDRQSGDYMLSLRGV